MKRVKIKIFTTNRLRNIDNMDSSEIYIIKRDGKPEAFSLQKIKNAIAKAFLSVGSFATQEVITTILSRVDIRNGTTVEDIQNQVE